MLASATWRDSSPPRTSAQRTGHARTLARPGSRRRARRRDILGGSRSTATGGIRRGVVRVSARMSALDSALYQLEQAVVAAFRAGLVSRTSPAG